MISRAPQTPGGSGPDANWFRWAQDAIMSQSRVGDVSGFGVNRTTRGTYTTKSSVVAPTGVGIRLFNYNNNAYLGATLRAFDELDGYDVGSTIPGWDGEVEDEIASGLTDGRRIRTSFVFHTSMQRTDPNAFCSVGLYLYAGVLRYSLKMDLELHPDADSSEDLLCYSGEISGVKSGANITIEEAAVQLSHIQTGAQSGTMVPFPSAITSSAITGSQTDITTGKIIGFAAQINNIYGSIGLRKMTVDSLPAILTR